MAFNIFATATSDIPLANLDANFTMIGSSAVASTLYPTATTSITYGTAGTTHYFSGSGLAVTGTLSATGLLTLTGTGTAQSVTRTAATASYITVTDSTRTASFGMQADNTMFVGARSAHNFDVYANNTVIGRFSSTGLAVTGTLSASGNTNSTLDVTVTNASTGTAAQSRFVAVGGSTTIIGSLSSGYTTNGQFQANRGYIYNTGSAGILYGVASGSHIWSIDGGATANMILDSSGNLLVGVTSFASSNTNSLMFQVAAGGGYFQHASGTSGGATYCQFNYNATNIGSITQNGTTGVLYNLTSDYRLKNNQQPLTGAKDFIMALKPKKWQWWDGSGEGVGFVAHEFMEVAKYSGHGEKDAVEMQQYEISPAVPATLDEEGNEVTAAVEAVMCERLVPKYQSIQPSSSEVMANLVAHIQELESRLAALEAK
jgi:hypothetical protein